MGGSVGLVAAEILADHEYDAAGWPLAKITLTPRSYLGGQGQCSCWLAEFADLPGYYGEGETIEQALQRLRQSLGARPHYRVEHKFRSPEDLKADIERHYKALSAAALSRADGIPNIASLPHTRGGGSVDERAKEAGIGKRFVTRARAKLSEEIDSSAERLIAGASKGALEKTAEIAAKRCAIDIRNAKQTPWRFEHAAARAKFPTKNR